MSLPSRKATFLPSLEVTFLSESAQNPENFDNFVTSPSKIAESLRFSRQKMSLRAIHIAISVPESFKFFKKFWRFLKIFSVNKNHSHPESIPCSTSDFIKHSAISGIRPQPPSKRQVHQEDKPMFYTADHQQRAKSIAKTLGYRQAAGYLRNNAYSLEEALFILFYSF